MIRNNNCWSQSEHFRLNALTCTTSADPPPRALFCTDMHRPKHREMQGSLNKHSSIHIIWRRNGTRRGDGNARDVAGLFDGVAVMEWSSRFRYVTLIYGWKLLFFGVAHRTVFVGAGDWNMLHFYLLIQSLQRRKSFEIFRFIYIVH